MNLLALDLSLTSTGYAAKYGPEPVASGTFTPKGEGVYRLYSARGWLAQMVRIWKPDVAVLEGYSFGSTSSHVRAIGELGGVIRLQLYDSGVPVVEVAPKTRAKLATGNGNAGKEQVLVEAVKRLGYGGHSNDEADALWLLQVALIRWGLSGAVQLPRTHLVALDAIEWPEISPARRTA